VLGLIGDRAHEESIWPSLAGGLERVGPYVKPEPSPELEQPEMRLCSECGESKLPSEFYTSGQHKQCKACVVLIQMARRDAVKDRE
jgi:hypothetical protein